MDNMDVNKNSKQPLREIERSFYIRTVSTATAIASMNERTGRLILLNGASSSGKTSIAKGLQSALPDPYLHVSFDSFLHQLPEGCLADNQYLSQALPRLLAGFHAANVAVVEAGNNVILDHVLQEPSWVELCVTAFRNVDVIFVGVHCSLEVLEAREEARGDRERGTARYQHERIHSHRIYDVEVDTSKMSVEECAAVVHDYVQSGRQPTVFEKLRSRMIAFK